MVIDFDIFFPLLMVIFICWVLWNRNYFYALWHLPGPFAIPFIGNFFWYLRPNQDVVDVLLKYVVKHKGQAAVWVGPQLTFFITDPDHLKTLFTSHHCLDHGYLHDMLKITFGEGVFTSNGQNWKVARKMCNAAFHPNVVRRFVHKFHKHTAILIELLRQEVGKGVFKSFPYIRNCTVDIILDTQCEYDNFKCQYKKHEEVERIEFLMRILFRRAFNFWEQPKWLFQLLPVGRYYNQREYPIRKMFIRIIEEQKREYDTKKAEYAKLTSEEKSFIHRVFEIEGVTEQLMQDHLCTILLSGFETSANTLGFVLLMLGVHQDVQDKVFEEDRQIQEKLNYQEPDADDLNLYVYLEQVIKETLRLFPVGVGFMRKAKENVKFGEHFVPAGSNIVGFAFLTHRRPDLFKDPLVFNPENFSSENVEKRHPYAYNPFSAGPRNCIGKKYAWLLMKVIVSRIVRNFRIIANEQAKDVIITTAITLNNPHGYRIRLENR